MKWLTGLFLVYITLNEKASSQPNRLRGKNYCTAEDPGCRSECPLNHFLLPGMKECHPYLTCEDFREFKKQRPKKLGEGRLKKVVRFKWKDHAIAVNLLTTWHNPNHKGTEEEKQLAMESFNRGLDYHIALQTSKHVTQLLGYCREDYVYATQFYGGTDPYTHFFVRKGHELKDSPFRTVAARFELCKEYAKVAEFLADTPLGTGVHCDPKNYPTTEGISKQFLISDDLKLLLNDMDGMQFYDRKRSKAAICTTDGITAHEPYEYPYENDIYSIPLICDYFLFKSTPETDNLRWKLLNFNAKCHAIDLSKRPNATQALEFYNSIDVQ